MSVLVSPQIPSRARELVRQIWPQLPRENWQETHYVSLAQHFESQYNELCEPSATSVEELFKLLQFLKRNVTAPRTRTLENLKEELRARQLPLVRAENLMELLARSWLTMNITINPHPPSFPYQTPVDWEEGKSLQTVVADTFKALGGARDGGQRVVESTLLRRFTIPNLVQDYRWTVQWTSNLADHLLIERMGTGKRVTIYEHKICLLNHLQYGQDCPVPRDALEEALDTLNLLFPPTDPATHRYLKAQHRPFHQLGFCSRNVKRDLQHYRYWQNNLVDLLHDLEEQPYGLGQLRLDKDRRNLLQFATFWIATIVALLTVISIAFGVVSTVYAARQYNLALAQACSTPDGAVNLPEYCS